jgi:hypothetical protein
MSCSPTPVPASPCRPPRRLGARTLAGAVVAVLALGAAACGSSEPTTATAESTTTVGDAPVESTTTLATTTQPPATEPPVDVGTLPQTDTEPTESGEEWERNVGLLWEAIVTDDPEVAMPFFFPEGAYLQVKRMTEAEATADYANRLIAYYEEDIHALHRQLGNTAETAELVELSVPPAAQWIQPGVEYNKGSYWRVLNSSLVYEVGGVQRSFPVASMISWRGEWYIVHLSSIR